MNELNSKLHVAGYVADSEITSILQLMQTLQRPLLLEGEAGVGKTAIAQALATATETELIRLQCYEGLDSQNAVYEWNYAKQLLWINMQEKHETKQAELSSMFEQEFLLERPLLKAITQDKPPVLLIDEIDRADEAFEAFLLELLSEYQISIPEYGTINASCIPMVILTSNGVRHLSDALRRRCLYYYMDYPDHDREMAIIQQRLPDIEDKLSSQIVNFVQQLRQQDLRKRPGIAETLDWALALMSLNVNDMTESDSVIQESLGCLLKTREDREYLNNTEVQRLIRLSA